MDYINISVVALILTYQESQGCRCWVSRPLPKPLLLGFPQLWPHRHSTCTAPSLPTSQISGCNPDTIQWENKQRTQSHNHYNQRPHPDKRNLCSIGLPLCGPPWQETSALKQCHQLLLLFLGLWITGPLRFCLYPNLVVPILIREMHHLSTNYPPGKGPTWN